MDITIVKNILGITTTNYDSYLAEVTPHFVEFAKMYCNQTFLDANGNESLPGPVKIFVAKACEYNLNEAGVTMKQQGVTYQYTTDLPQSIMRYLQAFRRLTWDD